MCGRVHSSFVWGGKFAEQIRKVEVLKWVRSQKGPVELKHGPNKSSMWWCSVRMVLSVLSGARSGARSQPGKGDINWILIIHLWSMMQFQSVLLPGSKDREWNRSRIITPFTIGTDWSVCFDKPNWKSFRAIVRTVWMEQFCLIVIAGQKKRTWSTHGCSYCTWWVVTVKWSNKW